MTTGLATKCTGSGAPVALIHGWGLNLAVWDSTVAALASGHRCIAIDLPGHGRSAWSDSLADFDAQLACISAALPEQPCAIIGWSLGGLFATALAARHPERVSRLVLVATLPRFLAARDWPFGLGAELLEKFASQLASNYRGTVSDFVDLQTRGSLHADAVRAELRSALRERGDAQPPALAAGLQILERSDLRRELAGIACPALLIGGQYDRIVAPTGMQALAALLQPRATLHIVPRAAHAPFASHSQIFNADVRMFLDDH